MKKSYLLLTLIMPLVACMSCSSSESSKKNDSSASDSTTKVTNAKDSTKTAEEKSKKLVGTQAQLNYMKNSGSWAKYQSGVLPAMAQDAPEYCEKVLESGKNTFVIVDKAKMHLFIYDKFGNILKKYPIACARNYGNKRKKGDSRTTEGIFMAEGVYDSRNWLFTNDAGYTSPARGVYGPWFVRVIHPIGIHGTSAPGSIGRRCSHGCIRVSNDNIVEVIKYVEAGTPIIVSPGPQDMAVNAREGAPTLSVVTEPGTPKAVPGKDTSAQYLASNGVSNKSSKKDDNAAVSSKKDNSSASKDASAKSENAAAEEKAPDADKSVAPVEKPSAPVEKHVAPVEKPSSAPAAHPTTE